MKMTFKGITADSARNYVSPQADAILTDSAAPVCVSGFDSTIEDLNEGSEYNW